MSCWFLAAGCWGVEDGSGGGDRSFYQEELFRNSFSLLSGRTGCLQLLNILEEMKFTRGKRVLLQWGDRWAPWEGGGCSQNHTFPVHFIYADTSSGSSSPRRWPCLMILIILSHPCSSGQSESLRYFGLHGRASPGSQYRKDYFTASHPETGWLGWSQRLSTCHGPRWIPPFCFVIIRVSVLVRWQQFQCSDPTYHHPETGKAHCVRVFLSKS